MTALLLWSIQTPLIAQPKLNEEVVASKRDNKSKSLKILTYNIWNGFDWGKDTFRRRSVQSWIKNQNADVVALQELCNYTTNKLKEDALSWGHKYSILLKTTGYSVGITSSNPIILKEKIVEGMHHGSIHCESYGIDFLVIHLHPGSIKRRREETIILLSKLEEIRKTTSNYIVLGDYNAHSPIDDNLYPPTGNLLTRLKKNNKDKGLKGNLDYNDLDYAVLSAFLSFPLYDVVRPFTNGLEERGSFPGRVLGAVNKESTQELISRLERIDYILVSPNLYEKCINANVANGQENWYLSDHYPVIAEFIFAK